MNFKDTLPGVFLCVAMFACGHARANMLVYPMAAEINSSPEEATSLFVYSKSDHVQYIRTRIMRIEHPGMPQEKEVPAGNDIETGLVVSPEKFALSPGTKKQYVLSVLRHRKERKPGGYTSRLFLNWKMIHRQVESKIHP